MMPSPDLEPKAWWLEAVNRYGVNTVLCVALILVIVKVWTGQGAVTAADVSEIKADMKTHIAQMKLDAETTQSLERETIDIQRQQVRLLQVACINAAKTFGDRSECLK